MRKITQLMAVALVVLATSCGGGSNDLLKYVPAEGTTFVAIVDGEKIIESKNEIIEEIGNPMASELEAIAKAVDMKNIVTFMGDKTGQVVLFNITDKKLFDEGLKAKGFTAATESGYTLYSEGTDAPIIVDGNIGWLVSEMNSIPTINKVKELAKQRNITSKTGVAESLATAKHIGAAVCLEALDESFADTWVCADVQMGDVTVVDGKFIKGDGAPVKIPGMQPLSNDFLRYVPADFNIAAAIGVNKDFPWEAIANFASYVGGYNARGVADALLPYLQNVDGTIAVAAQIGNETFTSPDLENLKFIAMMRLPQSDVNEAIGTVRQNLMQYGIPYQELTDGLSFDYGGIYLHINNVDGYLAVSTIEMTPTQSNSFNPTFVGKNGAFEGTFVDSGKTVNVKFQLEESTFKLEIKM